MSVSNRLATSLIAGSLLLAATVAQAKGPQGVGAGTSPSNSASPNSQGIGSNSWTQPPGWSKADTSKGWDGGTSPPGFDSPAKASGWNGDPLPPGLEKR